MAGKQQDLVVKMTINSQDFEKGLTNAKKKFKTFEDNISKAAKTLGKLAAAYAAATAAAKTYESFAKQTQTWGDELANTLSACTTAWHTLQSEIIQGGNIAVGRMRELYAEAYKLAELKDRMGTLQTSQKLNKSLYLTPYNEARADYQEAKTKGDKEGMKAAYAEMQRNLNDYAKESRDLINTSRDAAKQLLKAHGVTLKEGQDIRDLVLEVRDAQNGNLMGITETLRDLSKKTYTTMHSPTAGAISVESGGLEWGKAKMRNMGYSDAQIAAAERQLRMSEINDEVYNEFANDILAATNALDEIAALKKAMNRLVNGTTTPVVSGGGGTLQPRQATDTIPQLAPISAVKDEDFGLATIEQVNRALEMQGIIMQENQILVKVEDLLWQNRINTVNTYASALNQASSAFSSLADIVGDDSPFKSLASAMGGVMSQIASFITTYASLISVQAVSESIKAGNGIPFPYNLVAIAAAGSTLLGIIASMKNSFAGQFANGGIVGGNSYTGDRLIARVNSGEMILNRQQQAALFSGGQGGNVNFVIEGSQLKGVLDNYNKTTAL